MKLGKKHLLKFFVSRYINEVNIEKRTINLAMNRLNRYQVVKIIIEKKLRNLEGNSNELA
jgi:hypothetical protein